MRRIGVGAVMIAATLAAGAARAGSLGELVGTMGVNNAIAGPGASSGAGSVKAARGAIERSMSRSAAVSRSANAPAYARGSVGAGNMSKAWATSGGGSGKGWATASSSGRGGGSWATAGSGGRGSSSGGSGWVTAGSSGSTSRRR